MKFKNTRFVQHPIVRIIFGILVVGVTIFLFQLSAGFICESLNVPRLLQTVSIGVGSAAVALLIYWAFFRYLESRSISELSLKYWQRNILIGILLGGFLQALTILVIYIKGGYTVTSVNPIYFLLAPFTMALTSGIIEEIIVRGIIFRIMEEKLGSYIALIISALIFGALHLGNPNSTLLAALGLALQAGTFLAAAYMYSRNLWFPIAIHFAWNFTQAGIFGATVSGNAVKNCLLTSNIEGDTWYTGGAFGPEGSVQATVFCVIATIILLIRSHKENKIIPPSWMTKVEVDLS